MTILPIVKNIAHLKIHRIIIKMFLVLRCWSPTKIDRIKLLLVTVYEKESLLVIILMWISILIKLLLSVRTIHSSLILLNCTILRKSRRWLQLNLLLSISKRTLSPSWRKTTRLILWIIWYLDKFTEKSNGNSNH